MGPGMNGPGAFAQANFDAVKTALGLTDAQLTQLRQLRQQEFEANGTIREQMADRQRALQTAMERATPNAGEIGGIMVDILNLRKQIQTAADRYRTQALALLTAEQKTKLKGLEDAAKLQPAIMQAGALNLLDLSELMPAGMGFGSGRNGMGPGHMPGRRAGQGRFN